MATSWDSSVRHADAARVEGLEAEPVDLTREPYARFVERVVSGEIALPTVPQIRARLEARHPGLTERGRGRASVAHTAELLARTILTGIAAALSLSHGHYIVLAGLIVLQGVNFYGLAALMHELVHGSVFRSARANRALGRLVSLPLIMRFTAFQRSHLLHHKYNQTSKDPKTAPESGSGLVQRIMRVTIATFRRLYDPAPKLVQRVLAVLFIVLVTLPSMLLGYEFSAFGKCETADDRLEVGLLVAFWGGIGLVMGPLATALLFLLPMFIALQLVWAVFLTHSHARTIHPVEHRAEEYGLLAFNVVNLSLGRPLDRLGWYFSRHHVEHHLFPSLPFHQLPAVATALKKEYGIYMLPVTRLSADYLREGVIDAFLHQQRRTIAGRDYLVTSGIDR